jgi:hypothetical protein
MSDTAATISRLRSRVPPDLAARRVWVCYRERGDRTPLQPNGEKAEGDDPTTWSPLDACLQAVATGRMFTIGYKKTDPLDGPDPDDDTPDVEDQCPARTNSLLDVVDDFVTAGFLVDLAKRDPGMGRIHELLGEMAMALDAQQYQRGAMLLVTRAFEAGRETEKDPGTKTSPKQQTKFPGATRALRMLQSEGCDLSKKSIGELQLLLTERWSSANASKAAITKARQRLLAASEMEH